MTVYKKRKNGKPSQYWYYNFEFNGKRHNKSTGKTTKAEAREVEAQTKEELQQRYDFCMTDGASDILLSNAMQLALDKPTQKPRHEKQNQRKRQVWSDFMGWITEHFPAVDLMNQVTRPIAESYITHLREYGKHNKVIKQVRKKSFVANHKLAPKTLNTYHKEIQWAFEQLIADAGLSRNPFTHIKKLRGSKVKREAYTNEEILLIEKNLDDNLFCKHLYYIGTGTGMRMGNICLLDWKDIDMSKRIIRCENLKTGGKLTVPILSDLYEYLLSCEPEESGYISEAHAKRYLNNETDVSLDFTKFLNRIGIETKTYVKGRSRACNIKGAHAMVSVKYPQCCEE